MHGLEPGALLRRLDGLRDDSDIDAVSRVGECSNQKLVIFLPVDMTCVTAINLQVVQFHGAQVAEGVEAPAKMVQASLASKRAQPLNQIARVLGIDLRSKFRELNEQTGGARRCRLQLAAEPLNQDGIVYRTG